MALAADKCYLSSFNLLLSVPSSVLSYPSLPHSLSLSFHLRMPQAGSRGQAQAPGAGARPPRPGPRWVPEAATPETGPGSPAPRPACPNLRRATGRCGWEKREAERRGSKGRFAVVTEADGGMEGEGESPPFMERPSGSPVKVGRIWSEGHRCSF